MTRADRAALSPSLSPSVLLAALASLLIAPGFAGCQATSDHGPRSGGHEQEEQEDSDDQDSGEQDLAFELTAAKRELEIAELEQRAATAQAEQAIKDAEAELAKSQRDLAHFEQRDAVQEQLEAELELQRSSNRLIETKDELSELEAMYAQENFAERTKELVLTRGQRNLEIAEAAHALEQRKLETVRDFEHAAKRADLELEVAKAQVALARAHEALVLERAKAALAIDQKQHAILELEQKLAKKLADKDL